MKFKALVYSLLLATAVQSMPVPQSAIVQAEHLQRILQQADEAYYNRDESLFSDSAYDTLREQLKKLQVQYPELETEEAVGAAPAKKTAQHSAPVLSLKKAYSDAEIHKFIDRCGSNQWFCVEPKIDGLTLVVEYRNALLYEARTRGDGHEGENVTDAVMASGAVPLQLTGDARHITIRGELFMRNEALDQLNEQRKLQGQKPLKSARNSAAGSLRLKDFRETASRKLEFQAFSLRVPDWPTHTKALALMKQSGIPVIDSNRVKGTDVIATMTALRQSALPTDGVVIKLDDLKRFEDMGATSHHPRGAIARKWKTKPIETVLRKVEWSLGEKGRWTPVAHFDPVEINGATIQRATLHNIDHISALDLRIDDHILVIRSGGTIPEIIAVQKEKRTGAETPVPDRN